MVLNGWVVTSKLTKPNPERTEVRLVETGEDTAVAVDAIAAFITANAK